MTNYNILLASTSTLYGGSYLDYLKNPIRQLFNGIDEIIFIPFARPSGISHDEYTEKARSFFKTIAIDVRGLHEFENQQEAIAEGKGFFTGGGNTFLLIKTLHENNLLPTLKENIMLGKPYLGCSAGSNIGGINIQTTNDMPIVYPSSFEAMGLIPFNINPHYLDPTLELKHNGETRETRIKEFHTQNDITVIGLREGNWIRRKGDKIIVEGNMSTRIFQKNKSPFEVPPNTNLTNL